VRRTTTVIKENKNAHYRGKIERKTDTQKYILT